MKANEKKRQGILLGIFTLLSIVLFFDQGGFNMFIADVTKAVTKPKMELKESAISKINLNQYINKSAIPIEWDGEWGDDPFFYLNEDTLKKGMINSLFGDKLSGVNEVALVLNGISLAGDSKLVLINGNILNQGDPIMGYTVDTIEENYVELRKSTKIVRLTLEQ